MKPIEEQINNDEEYQANLLYKNIESTLKDDINKFLYTRVPETMTIREFEKLSTKIYDEIESKW